MKKFIIIFLLLVATLPIFAQKKGVAIFGHAPSGLFINEDKSIKGTDTFLWSLDAVVSGPIITLNNTDGYFKTSGLIGAGGAFGYKHYKPLVDGTPICDWGVSAAVLTNVKINETVKTGIIITALVNVYNLTLGPAYLFQDKKLGLLVGANLTF